MRPLTNPLPPGSRIQITIVLEKTEFDTSNRQNKVGIPQRSPLYLVPTFKIYKFSRKNCRKTNDTTRKAHFQGIAEK